MNSLFSLFIVGLLMIASISSPTQQYTAQSASSHPLSESEQEQIVGSQPTWYVGIDVYVTGDLVYWCAGGALAGYIVGGTAGALVGAVVGGVLGWLYGLF